MTDDELSFLRFLCASGPYSEVRVKGARDLKLGKCYLPTYVRHFQGDISEHMTST